MVNATTNTVALLPETTSAGLIVNASRDGNYLRAIICPHGELIERDKYNYRRWNTDARCDVCAKQRREGAEQEKRVRAAIKSARTRKIGKRTVFTSRTLNV